MSPSKPMPAASIRKERRFSWAWLLPVLTLALAGWLVATAWQQRGHMITVLLPDGHGVKVGNAVRYRGIGVGEVREVALTDDLGAVRVKIGLRSQANRIARAGTQFWVVRPQLRLTGVEGLETLVGPRYLAVLPVDVGNGVRPPLQREFVGLAEPPVVETIEPGDLEIVLEAKRRGSLQRGAPVTYRQVRVGTVLSVGLASDGGLVEARVHVPKSYRPLIRQGTQFWDAGGMRTNLGLSGLRIEMDSLKEIITGGVAFATPPPDEAGDAVPTGYRFRFHDASRDEWREWSPTVAIGSSLLPVGAPLPQPLRATIDWRQGFILKGAKSRQGWVLQTESGLLGPADLLTTQPGSSNADPESVRLEVGGQTVELDGAAVSEVGPGVVRLEIQVGERVWPPGLTRIAREPEDCIAIGDPTAAPFPLAASRLLSNGTIWLVDPAVSVDAAWHGAAVLSRADGRLVGTLLVETAGCSVSLLPGDG